MIKKYTDYGCTATIKENRNGTANLKVVDQCGRTVRNTTHKSFNAAVAAWKRWCN